MTKGSTINRISLRVPPDLFTELEEKRFRLRTSFQKIGIALFTAWARGDTVTESAAKVNSSIGSIDTDQIKAEDIVQRVVSEIKRFLEEKINELRAGPNLDAELLRETVERTERVLDAAERKIMDLRAQRDQLQKRIAELEAAIERDPHQHQKKPA